MAREKEHIEEQGALSMNFRHIKPGRLRSAIGAMIMCIFISGQTWAGSGVVLVDDDAPPDGDGRSWRTAYRFLQDALQHARLPGSGVSEIRLAQGTYLPDRNEANPDGTGDRSAMFELVSDIALLGGFAGRGAARPDGRDIEAFQTLLSGDLAGDDVLMFQNMEENTHQIVRAVGLGPDTILDGLTVAGVFEGYGVEVLGGMLRLSDCVLERIVGPGSVALVLFSDAEVTVQSCDLRFNGNVFSRSFGEEGGAVLANGAKTLTIHDSVISDNESVRDLDGFIMGAVSVRETDLRMEDCEILRNSGGRSTGLSIGPRSHAEIFRTVFKGNRSFFNAPVLMVSVQGSSDPTLVHLEDCLFVGNQDGKAIVARRMPNTNAAAALFIDRCTIIHHRTAIQLDRANAVLSNCLVVSSFTALTQPRRFFAAARALSVDLFNCTLISTSSNADVQPVFLSENATINNCILWSSVEDAVVSRFPDDVQITASLVRGGWEGPGRDILDADPEFVMSLPPDANMLVPAAFDYRLATDSPALDAGDNELLASCLDLESNDRVTKFTNGLPPQRPGRSPAIVDLGAYERPGRFREEDCDNDGANDACAFALGLDFDCNHNGVPDQCEAGTRTIHDCNENSIPDACEIAEFDCNENGVLDDCDIAGRQSADCNGDGVPDDCQADCNADGVPDDCALASGASDDCNANGLPDDCEEDCNFNAVPDDCEVLFVDARSEHFAPLAGDVVYEFTIPRSTRALSPVEFQVEAVGDVGGPLNSVSVRMNGIFIGTVFASATPSCNEPVRDSFELTAGFYNLFTDFQPGLDPIFTIIPEPGIDGAACDGESSISIEVLFVAPPDTDLDGDGTPDLCRCLGDIDEDGIVTAYDLNALLAAWGRCGVACSEDWNGDGIVDVSDLLLLVHEFGSCP